MINVCWTSRSNHRDTCSPPHCRISLIIIILNDYIMTLSLIINTFIQFLPFKLNSTQTQCTPDTFFSLYHVSMHQSVNYSQIGFFRGQKSKFYWRYAPRPPTWTILSYHYNFVRNTDTLQALAIIMSCTCTIIIPLCT